MIYELIKPFIPKILWLIGIVLIVAAIAAFLNSVHERGYKKANDEWQIKWDNQVSLLERQRAEAIIAEIKKENQFLIEISKVKKDAQITINRMATDLANSDAAGDRLHNALARLAAGADRDCKSSGAAGGSKTTKTAIDLCADVSARLDKRAGEFAKFADESRNAGLACEASYKIISQH